MSQKNPPTPQKGSPKYIKFLFGGGAGMAATCFVHPLDVVKNRMQMSGIGGGARLYKNSFHALSVVFKGEGLPGIYSGLSAGLLRQASYTTVRLGVFTSLFEYVSDSNNGRPPNFAQKVGISVVAGLIGAFCGTPAELTLIRMTTDGRLPVEQRRGYKNAFHALYKISREDGIRGLWRGCLPTMGRAAVINVAQLASYSQAKEYLLTSKIMKDGIFCHFCASMFSGLVCTFSSLPVDIVKTRIQNMRTINGVPEYSGVVDVFTKTVQKEGVLSLWKGFTPYYLRIGPHTVLTFIFLEQMNKLYRVHVLNQDANSGRSSM